MKKRVSLIMVVTMVMMGSVNVMASDFDSVKDKVDEANELLEEIEQAEDIDKDMIDETGNNEEGESLLDKAEERMADFDLETYLEENEETLWIIKENTTIIRPLEVEAIAKAYELQMIVQDKLYSFVPITNQEIEQIQSLYESYEDEIETLKQEAEALKIELQAAYEVGDYSAYDLETVVAIQEREIEGLIEINSILDELIKILG